MEGEAIHSELTLRQHRRLALYWWRLKQSRYVWVIRLVLRRFGLNLQKAHELVLAGSISLGNSYGSLVQWFIIILSRAQEIVGGCRAANSWDIA